MLWNYQNKKRTYCRCVGTDNKEYIIRQDALMSGATHTIHGACSGGISKDISGQKFGRLTAIKPTQKRAANGNICWKCECDCGNIAYSTYSNLKRGHTTSCGCAKEDFIESCKLDIIGKKFGYLTVLEEVGSHNGKRKMKCLCDCGNFHICTVSDLTTGHTMSCGCMCKSKGEMYIEEILNTLDITYEIQKRFDDCKNKRTLPFDFFLPDFNICIEYDGEQHFKPIKFWGGEKRFYDRINNDNIKTIYCNENGIKLVRIIYTKTKDEIFDIISNLVSPATITA